MMDKLLAEAEKLKKLDGKGGPKPRWSVDIDEAVAKCD